MEGSAHITGSTLPLLSVKGHANLAASSPRRFTFRLQASEKEVLLRVSGDQGIHGDEFIWETLDTISEFLDHFQTRLDIWRKQSREPGTQAYTDTVSRRASRLLVKMSQQARALPNQLFVRGTRLYTSTPVSGGGYADIFVGKLQGQDVALKRVRVFTRDVSYTSTVQKIMHEALTWRQLQHINVLQFFGVDMIAFNGAPCLISPWMPHGNILKYLEGRNAAGKATLGLIERLSLEIINGLVYLHSQSIVHGDLRGPNILIDTRGCARLADFGLSRIVSETATHSTTASSRGSIRWMAPEQLNAEERISIVATCAIDVYSFACVLLELYTLKVPFFYIKADTAVALQIMCRKHPERPQPPHCIIKIPDITWSFMQECWSADPNTRIYSSQLMRTVPIHEPTTALAPEGSAQNTSLDLPRLHRVSTIVRNHILDLLSQQTVVYRRDGSNTLLHHAAATGDEMLLAALLFLGAGVDTRNNTQARPLHLAALNGRERIVNALLLHGANVNARDDRNLTPLHQAVWKGCERVMNALLSYGADVNARDIGQGTPLHVAAHSWLSCREYPEAKRESVLKTLLLYGADVHARNNKNRTPLHLASLGDTESMATALLLDHSDVNARDHEGCTPLHNAARFGHERVSAALLLHGADVNARDKDQNTPLHATLRPVGNLSDVSGTVIKTLLSHGADVRARDNTKSTPLHLAARRFKDASILNDLLSHGADVQAVDDKQRTPLHWASLRGIESMVTALLAADGGFESVITALLSHGANLNARDIWDSYACCRFSCSRRTSRFHAGARSLTTQWKQTR